MDILLLIAGVALILLGANYLTEGASALAARFGIPEFLIGLTVVAIGTSMPELVVSVMSGMRGNSDIAIGNVVGSNMFNTFIILGITAFIRPLRLTQDNIRKDIPFMVLASLLLLAVVGDVVLDQQAAGVVSRTEGLMLLGFFVIFMAYTIFSAGGGPAATFAEKRIRVKARRKSIWLILLMIAGGLGGLVWGGDLFLNSATSIARSLGVSEAVIAVTLVAAGTSMPELATSVVAAVKGNVDMALGNIIGSNISNIFLVLGASAAIKPLDMGDIIPGDAVAVIGSSVVIFLSAFFFRKRTIGVPEGIVYLLLYGAYVAWLLAR